MGGWVVGWVGVRRIFREQKCSLKKGGSRRAPGDENVTGLRGGGGLRWGRESWEQNVATEAGSGSGVFLTVNHMTIGACIATKQ